MSLPNCDIPSYITHIVTDSALLIKTHYHRATHAF